MMTSSIPFLKYAPKSLGSRAGAPALALYLVVAGTLHAQWLACGNGSAICTTNKVGIGTTAPGSILDINGGGQNTYGRLFSGSASSFSYFSIGRAQDELSIGVAGAAGQIFNVAPQGAATLKANYGPLMIGISDYQPTITITNGGSNPGKVGIGTASPVSALSVLVNAADGQATFANGITFVNNGGNSANNPWTHAAIWSQGSEGFNGSLLFGTDGDGVYTTNNGITERMRITSAGNVGIGTTSPQYPLSVNGTIQAKEVIVNTGWADYVFKPGYTVPSLENVAAYIKENHHLPDIPTESDIVQHGARVGEIEAKLLAKIEELTLQLINLNESNKELKSELESVKRQIAK